MPIQNNSVNEVSVKDTNLAAVPGTDNSNQSGIKEVKNPRLLEAVSQLNFNYPVGSQYSLAQGPYTQLDDTVSGGAMYTEYMRIPGICALKYIPTFGIIRDSTDPINTASNTLFGKTMIKLSTTITDIDPPDQFMYLIAISSIATGFNLANKLYLCLRSNSFDNKYLQRHLVETMGFDYEDFLINGANLYWRLGKWASDLTQFVLPKDITVVSRHLALSSMVYKDIKLKRCQYFNFTPAGVWKNDSANGKLTWHSLGSPQAKMTFAQFVQWFEDLMAACAGDNGYVKIATLLKRIYTDPELFRFKLVNQNDVLSPVYDEARLLEIHNADVLEYSSVSNFEITQQVDANVNWQLHFDPTFTSNDVGIGLKRQIDVHSEKVTSAEVLTAMKLKFAVRDLTLTPSSGIKTGSTFKLKTCGTEIISNAFFRVLKYGNGEAMDIPFVQHPSVRINNISTGLSLAGFAGSNDNEANARYSAIVLASVFHDAPIVYPVGIGTSGEVRYELPIGDLNNFTIVEDAVLEKAQSAMMYDHLGLDVGEA